MNVPSSLPTFGDKLLGQTYIERPGAYALIPDAQQRIATLRVGTAFFLLGGGSAPNETPQITLHREIMEECGRAIQIGPRLGKAIEYIMLGTKEFIISFVRPSLSPYLWRAGSSPMKTTTSSSG